MGMWHKVLVNVNLFLFALNIVLVVLNYKEGFFSNCLLNILAMACNAFGVWRLERMNNAR